MAYMFCNSLSSYRFPLYYFLFTYCSLFIEYIKLLVGIIVAHSLHCADGFLIVSLCAPHSSVNWLLDIDKCLIKFRSIF